MIVRSIIQNLLGSIRYPDLSMSIFSGLLDIKILSFLRRKVRVLLGTNIPELST